MNSIFWLSAIIGGLLIVNSGSTDVCSPVNLDTKEKNSISPFYYEFPLSLSFKISSQLEVDISFKRSNPSPTINTAIFNYTSHAPVNVTSDDDLANVAVTGSGTENNPYILENWNITTTGVHGIAIQNTTTHFIIRNCWITTGNVEDIQGIYITNVMTGMVKIAKNICQENDRGIFLNNSRGAIISNNICTQNRRNGIHIGFSGNSTVLNNNCTQNGANSIQLWYLSGNSTVLNNTCTQNMGNGIHIGFSGHSTVANNTFVENGWNGIRLYYSGNSTVVNNTCTQNGLEAWDPYRNGIFLSNSGNTTVINNTCTQNQAMGILVDSSGSSMVVNNICTANGNSGIVSGDSSSLTIVNNTCNENGFQADTTGFGITLQFSSYSSVLNNTCSNNRGDGIHLWESNNSTIVNNTCNRNIVVQSWNGNGIDMLYSSGTNVINNKCSQNERSGIRVGGVISSKGMKIFDTQKNDKSLSLWQTENVTLVDNFCIENGQDGITLEMTGNSLITNNTCSLNRDSGIKLQWDSGYCLIYGNFLTENENYGVLLNFGCEYNLIYQNEFINNNPGATQGRDNGNNNQWYETTTNEGNYWSDYDGVGPYQIDGGAGATDPFPIFKPLKIPWVDFWRFLVFGNPETESIEVTTLTSDKTGLVTLPYFPFFLLSIGIISIYWFKRKLID